MASAPAAPFPGTPSASPGLLETTTPVPFPLPPLFGGATSDPASNWPPSPAPWAPRPVRPTVPSPKLGAGGTASSPPEKPAPAPPPRDCPPGMPNCTGGGTTEVPPSPPVMRLDPLAVPNATGGGTTCFSTSRGPNPGPRAATSRETLGGGATTDADGRVNLEFRPVSRSGAETGGGTTSNG